MNATISLRCFSYAKDIPIVALDDTVDYHDITICIRGQMNYCIDSTAYTLDDGDCIYIAPGSRRIRAKQDSPATYVSINLFGTLPQPLPASCFRRYLSADHLQLLSLLRSAHAAHREEKFLCLANYLLYDLQDLFRHQKEHFAVPAIKKYVWENLSRKIMVSDAISQVYLSKEYCETVFRRETGTTIVTYINSEKISLAKSLLLSGHPPAAVAQMLGYEDYNYFSRVFRKYAGLSPSKYRKLNP